MLFQILKAMGLDVPAQINALKADIDQRVEATTSQVGQAAQQAAVMAALYVLAGMAALLAIVVALLAIGWWVSDNYGVPAGLGVVFVILVIATAILGMVAQGRSKSLAVHAAKAPRALFGPTGAASDAGVAGPASEPPAAPAAASPSASGLVEPLAALLTGGGGRTIAAELLGGLNGTEGGNGPAKMALDRAANVIRSGDRSSLLTILGGAAVLGFLLTSQARR
jgi:hypothetical protein